MRRLLITITALAALLSLSWLQFAAPALAEDAGVTLSVQTVAPGGNLDVSGSGFSANSGVSLVLEGDQTVDLGRVEVDRKGRFSANVAVPTDVTTGRYSVKSAGLAPDNSALILAASLIVSGDPNFDPDASSTWTSALPTVLVTAAITAVVVSGIWVAVLRRRATSPDQTGELPPQDVGTV